MRLIMFASALLVSPSAMAMAAYDHHEDGQEATTETVEPARILTEKQEKQLKKLEKERAEQLVEIAEDREKVADKKDDVRDKEDDLKDAQNDLKKAEDEVDHELKKLEEIDLEIFEITGQMPEENILTDD